MCGIAGIVAQEELGEGDRRAMAAMLDALDHRGPDDRGTWVDPTGRALLGHTRLAILDLSDAGHEPIISHDGRYALTFNGEVFNHMDLRHELLRNRRFRGHCDAETLVELWGVAGEPVLSRLRGFFSFAIWSLREQRLVLVRDRLGEKPLYYAVAGRRLVFASELRAILASGLVARALSPDGVALYAALGNVPAPWTIVQDVSSLPPGSLMRIDPGCRPDPRMWWSPRRFQSSPGRPRPSVESLVPELGSRLRSSVAARLISDVPVGAFLSGGIDSSLITALAQLQAGDEIRTFTVGFEGGLGASDERTEARSLSRVLGTKHEELEVGLGDLARSLDDFFDVLDQPSGDAFNSYLASRAAAGRVKVILSGIGADELFYGYRFWRSALRLGPLGRRLRAIPTRYRYRLRDLSGGPHRLSILGRCARAVVASLAPETVRIVLLPSERRALGVPIGDAELLADKSAVPSDPGRQADLASYLSPMLLPDLDAMTMSFSMEARAPFLDHEVVEWALQIPAILNWDKAGGKTLVRCVAREFLSQEVLARPKQGFDLPFARWMSNGLSDEVDALVSSASARSLLDGPTLARLVSQIRDGRRDPRCVWHLLVLEAWLQRHLPDVKAVA